MLCLHGFTGTPFEVRPLAEGLAHQGFTVSAPLLPGHGTTVQALAATRWHDWLAGAEAALDKLLFEVGGGPVGIAGFSMGGLLALRLARMRPENVGALALMAVPLRLRQAEAWAIEAISRLPAVLRRGPLANLPKRAGFDVTDEDMQKHNPGLPALPLAGLASMMELAAVIRRDLPFLRVPTLVAHGDKDRTVPMEDSLEICGTIGSDLVERLWLPESGHLLAIDIERATLIESACRLFKHHLRQEAA